MSQEDNEYLVGSIVDEQLRKGNKLTPRYSAFWNGLVKKIPVIFLLD